MIRHNLKLAIRRLVKNRAYSFINLFGLSVGFASVLIIFLYVKKERSFDHFHSRLDNIEHLLLVTQRDGFEEKSTRTSGPVLEEFAPRYTEIERFSRYWPSGKLEVSSDSTGSKLNLLPLRQYSVDRNFLKIFDFELKYGQIPDFDTEVSALVVSESKAEALFGDSRFAVGSYVFGKSNEQYIVRAVVEDVPKNSSLRFDCLTSLRGQYRWEEGKPNFLQLWGNNNIHNVVLFRDGVSDERKAEIAREITVDNDERITYTRAPEYFEFQPFSEAHFDLSVSDHFYGKTDESNLRIFTAIALVILFASLANYCSLTLSQSVERIKEIGVKRTVGASRFNLIVHYFFESVLLTSLAFIMAIIMMEVFVPQLELVMNKDIGAGIVDNLSVLIGGFVAILLLSFLSVLYPALVASKKQISDFKSLGASSLFGRSTFISLINAVQTTIFIFLFAATLLVNQQLAFVQNDKLGFNKEQVLMVFTNTNEAIFKKEELKASMLKSPFVESAAISISYPLEKSRMSYASEEQLNFIEYMADAAIVDVLKLEIVEGRRLSKEEHHNRYVLLNETAVESLGLEEPIGKEFNGREIVGVIADFHAESKKEIIKPLAITLFEQDGFGWLMLRLKTEQVQAAVNDISHRYETVTGSSQIQYKFFDDEYDKVYSAEKVVRYLMQIFTGIALLISFLGILGSTSYAIKRRLKEISIRKVLGAGILDLNAVINKSSSRFLLLSVLLGIPLSYWWVTRWLEQFSYRINVGSGPYIFVILITAAIILPVMYSQVFRAYQSKTVDFLKDE
ncbi:ABC transporter permease [Roseivirga sp.]|uniref:ABC transporter permease n=1 Tax=Roseivirga sp. TaxID=1964215 RepID=UPI003B52BAEB